ncbi:MAG: response regulator [Thermoanaerobaculia bacterium]
MSTNRSVLVVDDDDAIRDLLGIALKRYGLDAALVANGEQAILSLREKSYDAVLLDLMMPVASGDDVLRFLEKERPGERSVIVISAVSPKRLEELRSESIYAVVSKPFDLEDLSKLVATCTEEVRNATTSEVGNPALAPKPHPHPA